MIPIVLHQLLWLVSLYGWGAYLLSKAETRQASAMPLDEFLDHTSKYLIAGIFLLVLVGGLVQLFLPFGGMMAILLLISGLAFAANILLAGMRNGTGHASGLGFFLSLMVLVVAGSFFAAGEIRHGDTGLYHIQAVKWLASDPHVAGIANLHYRFGFNSSWWVFAASLEIPSMTERSVFLVQPILLTAYGLALTAACLRIANSLADGADWLLALSIFLFIRQVTGENNPSFSTDLPTNLLMLLAGAALLRGIANPLKSTENISYALVVSLLAVSTKLFAIILFLGCVMVFGWHAWRKGVLFRPEFLGGRVAVLTVCFAFGCIWLARGMIASGYPMFPSQILGIASLPWAASADLVRIASDGIHLWPTRGIADDKGFWQSFSIWVANQRGDRNVIFLMFAAVAGFAVLLASVFLGRKREPLTAYSTTAAIAAAGLLFCLVNAPAMRFMSGYFFLFAGAVGAYLLIRMDVGEAKLRRWVIGGMVVYFLGSATLNLKGQPLPRKEFAFLHWPALKVGETTVQTTSSGLEVYVPDPGQLSWNAPLPSSGEFSKELKHIEDEKGRIRAFVYGR